MWPLRVREMDAAAERKGVAASEWGCRNGATALSGEQFLVLQGHYFYTHTLLQTSRKVPEEFLDTYTFEFSETSLTTGGCPSALTGMRGERKLKYFHGFEQLFSNIENYTILQTEFCMYDTIRRF